MLGKQVDRSMRVGNELMVRKLVACLFCALGEREVGHLKRKESAENFTEDTIRWVSSCLESGGGWMGGWDEWDWLP